MARDVSDAASATATISGEILDIPLDLIEYGDLQRPIDEVWAGALGRIMTAEGKGPGRNRSPIWVCRLPGKKTFLRVAGSHRLRGAQLEGWSTIRAILVSADAAERRLAEISENLWKKAFDPIDRASAIAELIDLQKVAAGVDPAKSGAAIAAQARWSDSLKEQAADASLTMRLAYGFAEEVAEQIGISRPTIYRDLELHRGLRPDVVAQIRDLPVAKNASQLRALAKLAEGDQRAVAKMIADGDAKCVTDAQALRSQKPAPDPQKKAFNAFIASWGRMGAKERRHALAEIAKIGLPTGVTLELGGEART